MKKSKDGMLRARVDANVQKAFEARAKQRGMKPSDMLREIVIREVGAESSAALLCEIAQQQGAEVGTKRVEIRLPVAVMRMAERRAAEKGMTLPRWVGALAQSHALKEPVMTDKEVLALRALVRELAALGRNVNQIARALNSAIDVIERSRVSLDDLARLDKGIEITKRVVRTLVHRSQQSWGVISGDNSA